MIKKISLFIFMVVGMPLITLAAETYKLADAKPWTTGRIIGLFNDTANFLLALAVGGAVIIIIYAGILYLTSGFNVNAVKNAKGILTNAIIGIAIVLAAGVIINTVAYLVTGDFFGTGTSTNAPVGLPINDSSDATLDSNATSYIAGDLGGVCKNGGSCNTGLRCSTEGATTMCVWKDGNSYNQPCLSSNDCKSAFTCAGRVCLSRCSVDTDCGVNSFCNGGVCKSRQVGGVGEPCSQGVNCNTNSGLTCKDRSPNGTICVRSSGNESGENCIGDFDCKSGLLCHSGVCSE
jgi:hypothetical protein